MLSVDEVCATILGQFRSKLGFWSEYLRGNPFFWVSCSVNLAQRVVCAMARSVEQHTLLCTSRAFEVVFRHPQVFLLRCFDVVLPNIVVEAYLTWILIGFTKLGRTLNEKRT